MDKGRNTHIVDIEINGPRKHIIKEDLLFKLILLKVYFLIHNPIATFFCKQVESFILVKTFRYIIIVHMEIHFLHCRQMYTNWMSTFIYNVSVYNNDKVISQFGNKTVLWI